MFYEISEIAPSAHRHRISDDSIRYVVAHWVDIAYEIDEELGGVVMTVFLGYDDHGNDLEIGAFAIEEGPTRVRLRVAHADTMRDKYRPSYNAAMGR